MKKAEEDLQKHTFNLFKGDMDKLKEIYSEVGATTVVRQLVRTHLNKIVKPVDIKKVKSEVEL